LTAAVAVLLSLGVASRTALADPLSGGAGAAVDDPLAPSDDEIVGEIVVDLDDGLSSAAIASLEQRYQLGPSSAWSRDHDHIEIGSVSPDREDAVLDALSHEPGVVHAERMEVFRASFVPDDPLYNDQWHLKRVGAETAWEYGCGRGVTVAVVDTGVACFDKGPFSRGSDLAGTRCEGGKNFVNDSDEAYDDQGHGTHVAGTVAQTTNNGRGTAGLAFCATLMPVKVLNKFGWGTLADVAEGVRFAADHGAQIVNMSLGGPRPSRILEDAVDYARDKGVLVVAAAGNSGRAVGYPAAYDGVLAVSATDSNDKIAWFSSRGPQVGIAAPGVGVTQQTICQGGRNKCELFGTFNGTSMASPHVAGSAALLMGLGVTDASAAKGVLTDTARQVPGAKPELFGAGIVDAGAALRATFMSRLAWRGGFIVALLLWIWRRIRRRGGKPTMTPGTMLGALFGGVGLLPILPLLNLLPRFGEYRWAGELLARPFGEWDVAWSAGLHRWLPLANALPVLGLMAVFFGVKRLRPTLGGFGVGVSALLLQLAVSLDVVGPFGAVATRVWLVANTALCLWLARTALQADKAGR
jgi:serine protease